MHDELTPEQKFNAESPETMVPRALLDGRAPEAIIADLVELDWSPRAAETFVNRVVNDIKRYQASRESRAALVNECRQQMISGSIMVLLGLVVTVASFFLMVTGVLYLWILMSGTIIAGFLHAGRGYSRWRLYRRSSLPIRLFAKLDRSNEH